MIVKLMAMVKMAIELHNSNNDILPSNNNATYNSNV